MSEARARLERCFAAVFPALGPAEIPHAAQASIAAWDSLASVTLAALVEEEFGVRIADDEFEEMTSFAMVLEMVQGRERS